MKLTKNKEIIHEDIDQELFIDDENINEELMEQPLLFRKYTKIKAKLVAKSAAIKQKLKETEARAYAKYAAPGNKVREIESSIDCDPDVLQLRKEHIEAERMVEEYEGIVIAFRQRHDVLKELSTNKRRDLID